MGDNVDGTRLLPCGLKGLKDGLEASLPPLQGAHDLAVAGAGGVGGATAAGVPCALVRPRLLRREVARSRVE